MDYSEILVNMDYSSDPLWVSGNGVWINTSLEEYEKMLSKPLLHSLEVYRRLWEADKWSRYITPNSQSQEYFGMGIVKDALEEIVPELAAQLKTELPDCRVFYRDAESNTVEISGDTKPYGIRSTLVG